MAKVRSKPAGVDEHARTIAKAIAKGRFPQLTPEIDEFLETHATDIFAASEGACRHLPPSGDDEALGFGYLFLLQMLLERVRYQADRGVAGATELIATFQAALVARVKAGELDGTTLAHIGGAMQQAEIAASPELSAISAELDQDEEALLPADVALAFDGLIEATGNDPFILVGTFAEAGHTLPEAAKAALARYMAGHDGPDARAAAVLFLLDPSAAVRHVAAVALAEAASSLSPVDLRRLIAMRNWRPEHERANLDAIIQKARSAGIACAPWEDNVAQLVQASPIDGSAAQMLRLILRVGRKKRLVSILTKDGIADAVSGTPQTRRELASEIEAAGGDDVPMLDVPRAYLDRTVSHHLAISIARGEVPPAGLLEVAEAIGGADWQPERIDFRQVLDELIAELPENLGDPDEIETALADSDVLVDLDGIEQSWFEDNAELREKVLSVSRRARDQLVTKLLQGDGAIAAHRKRWAELFVRTALWMREAQDSDELCWPDLVIVARAVLAGEDLTRIGLMRNIAERTVAVLSDDEDPW
jgi:hypothetical protein